MGVLTKWTRSVQYLATMCRECAQHPELVPECHERRAEVLRRVYLFGHLSDPALEPVLDAVDEIELDGDQWLFFQDDVAERFFLVLEGDLALVRHSVQGEELIVALVGPGELFEEDLVLVDYARHPVSARPLGRCRLARFDRRSIRRLLPHQPELVLKLAETLQRRNALLLEEIERRTVQDAEQRLVSFLASRNAATGKGLPLRFPKRVLASRLSIRPETLSRVLARLKGCDRLHEADGALVLAPEDGEPGACEGCPAAKMWGCPGPRPDGAAARGAGPPQSEVRAVVG